MSTVEMEVQRSGKHQTSLALLLEKLQEVEGVAMHLLEGASEENVVIFDKAPMMSVLAEEEGLRIAVEQLDDNCFVEKRVTWAEIVKEIGDFYVEGGLIRGHILEEDKEARLRALDTLEREIGLLRASIERPATTV